jgi:hypothetical protein
MALSGTCTDECLLSVVKQTLDNARVGFLSHSTWKTHLMASIPAFPAFYGCHIDALDLGQNI